MAVAVVGTPDVQSNTASGSDKTLTFASIAYGADEILTVDVICNDGSGMPTPGTPSGGSLTWTPILNQQGTAGNFTRTASWWAYTGAGSTFAVTQTTVRGTGGSALSTRGVLTRHSGAHATVPVGQTDGHNGTTDPLTSNTNLRLLGVLAGSMVHAAGGDWAASATITLTFDNSIADTEPINANESGQMHFCAMRSTSAVPSNIADLRCGMDVSGGNGNWSAVFYEILQATAATKGVAALRHPLALTFR